MTITQEVESLGIGSTPGCRLRGVHREIISGTDNTTFPYILSADESGALCLFGAADGGVFTLPPAEAGLWFEFGTALSVTASDSNTVNCASGDFIIGAIIGGSATIGGSGGMFPANGSTHLGITSNGSTTGGLIGDNFVLTAISGTQWALTQGVMQGSGTWSTPFTT